VTAEWRCLLKRGSGPPAAQPDLLPVAATAARERHAWHVSHLPACALSSASLPLCAHVEPASRVTRFPQWPKHASDLYAPPRHGHRRLRAPRLRQRGQAHSRRGAQPARAGEAGASLVWRPGVWPAARVSAEPHDTLHGGCAPLGPPWRPPRCACAQPRHSMHWRLACHSMQWRLAFVRTASLHAWPIRTVHGPQPSWSAQAPNSAARLPRCPYPPLNQQSLRSSPPPAAAASRAAAAAGAGPGPGSLSLGVGGKPSAAQADPRGRADKKKHTFREQDFELDSTFRCATAAVGLPCRAQRRWQCSKVLARSAVLQPRLHDGTPPSPPIPCPCHCSPGSTSSPMERLAGGARAAGEHCTTAGLCH
jgi:hypothetical protein